MMCLSKKKKKEMLQLGAAALGKAETPERSLQGTK